MMLAQPPVLVRLLRDRTEFIQEIHDGTKLTAKISAMLISSFVLFAIYGAIIGSFHGGLQALSSAIKLPILYLLTLMICLPTLYIFSALFGAQRSLKQYFAYLLTAATVIGLLLCGFAPVTLFFLTTIGVKDYSFFLLLNIFFFGLTGVIGIGFLYQVLRPVEPIDGETTEKIIDPNIKIRRNILRFWLVLYGFVGSQLGWILRPFFGSPGRFEWFRDREGNFLTGVWGALSDFLF
jgi:hypothetical protein